VEHPIKFTKYLHHFLFKPSFTSERLHVSDHKAAQWPAILCSFPLTNAYGAPLDTNHCHHEEHDIESDEKGTRNLQALLMVSWFESKAL